MNALAINTVGDHKQLEVSVNYCKSQGLGLETTDFAFPENLDGNLKDIIDHHRKVLDGVTPLLSHGPFLDLVAASPDPAIVAVANQRHEAALTASAAVGASYYVTHTNFTPMITHLSQLDTWIQAMLEFWLPLADIAGKHGMVICLENQWEPSPEIQADLIASAQHPYLKASFDNGHSLVFSDVVASEWIGTLGDTLLHCHLHDNAGDWDQHLSVGEGTEDWPALVYALRVHAPQAIAVAESNNLKMNKVSIDRLKTF